MSILLAMALLILGMTQCPLFRQAIEGDQADVATTHFVESRDHPLWRFSDAVMHYDCFQGWEQRAFFVADYNRLFGFRIGSNGTRHQMADDGSVTTIQTVH